MTQFADKALTKKIVDLKDAIETLEQYLIMRRQQHGKSPADQEEFENGLKELTKLNLSLKKAEGELEERNHRILRMQKTESKLLKLRQQSYHLAEPNKELVEKSPLERKWIMLQTRISLLEKFIAKERDALGLPRCLDISLIETIVAERKEIKNISTITTPKERTKTSEEGTSHSSS